MNKSTMPKELKAKWLEALRSGQYKQGKEALFDGQGYCCLGVLQVVVDGVVESHPAGDVLKYPSASWSTEHRCYSPDNESDGRSFDPVVPSESGNEDWVSHLNDRGVSFTVIADLIEQHVEGI